MKKSTDNLLNQLIQIIMMKICLFIQMDVQQRYIREKEKILNKKCLILKILQQLPLEKMEKYLLQQINQEEFQSWMLLINIDLKSSKITKKQFKLYVLQKLRIIYTQVLMISQLNIVIQLQVLLLEPLPMLIMIM